MKLSIIIPAHNEQDNIEETITRMTRTIPQEIEYEAVIVNDHSVDRTAEIVTGLCNRFPNLRLVTNSAAAGFANAIKAGFSGSRGEIFLPVMADLCDDLSAVKPMYEKILAGYDVVCGSRYIKGGSRLGGSKFKGALSCLAGRSIHLLLGIPTHDIANAFKMYKKNVIDSIEINAKGFEISMEIPLKAYFRGFKIAEVPTVWRERTAGKSSFKVFKLLPDYLKLYLWAIRKKILGG
ncbi:MAG: glycosyltransferase [Candidatus Omnitrophota bacterium]